MTFPNIGDRRKRMRSTADDELLITPILEYYGGDVPDVDELWKGMRCPFHEDRTASARVNATGFACLACSIRGNALTLIKEVEKCDWRSTVSKYEEITGRKLDTVQQSTRWKPGGDVSVREGDYEESSGFFSSRVRRKSDGGR